jgi:hypothetical protein
MYVTEVHSSGGLLGLCKLLLVFQLFTSFSIIITILTYYCIVFEIKGNVIKNSVRYHCGGWPEEVNTCFLNSYMVYS